MTFMTFSIFQRVRRPSTHTTCHIFDKPRPIATTGGTDRAWGSTQSDYTAAAPDAYRPSRPATGCLRQAVDQSPLSPDGWSL
jgi:hypothetical protein